MDQIDELYLLRQWLLERINSAARAVYDAYHALLFGWHAFRAEWHVRREFDARFNKALHDAHVYHRSRQKDLAKQRDHHRPRSWH